MIDLEFLEGLIRAIDESGIDSIEIERGGTRIRMAKTPWAPSVNSSDPGGTPALAPAPHSVQPDASPAPSAAAPPSHGHWGSQAAGPVAPPSNLVDVTSPMVGTFYRAPAPDAPAYVEVGSRVSEGDTLCIIEAMKLMNELECEVRGTVAEILAENAEPVEYGQVLFRIEPV